MGSSAASTLEKENANREIGVPRKALQNSQLG